MSIEEDVERVMNEAVGKEETRSALEAIRDHRDEIGDEAVETLERIVDHYGVALRYFRHHR